MRVLILALSFLAAGVAPAAAQTAATLTGAVTDPSGAALPGVQLTVRNTATGLTRTSTSRGDGRFVFADVPAGDYDVRAELSGFRPLVRRGVAMAVAQTLSLALVLEVGAFEQAVSVAGGAAAVNTETSELSFPVGERAVASLPLNGRNFTDLAFLQPGVVPYASRDGGSVVAHGLGMPDGIGLIVCAWVTNAPCACS